MFVNGHLVNYGPEFQFPEVMGEFLYVKLALIIANVIKLPIR